MRKTIDQSFADWEGHAFGFGYGTGEPHIFAALKTFLHNTYGDQGASYEYEALEKELTPTVAWLMINALCRVDIIEYGSSPRYGWLTEQGLLLRSYCGNKPVDDLYELIQVPEDYVHCYPDVCNCGPAGYQEGVKCPNPFWSGHTR